MTREFAFERSTKNTHRFLEIADNLEGVADPATPPGEASDVVQQMCGVIYVQKRAFANGAPRRIRVTVEEVTQ